MILTALTALTAPGGQNYPCTEHFNPQKPPKNARAVSKITISQKLHDRFPQSTFSQQETDLNICICP
jgi:hypothetical protein